MATRMASAQGPCPVAVVPAQMGFAGSGGRAEVEVQGAPGCAWVLESDTDWIHPEAVRGTAGELIEFWVEQLPEGVTARSGGFTVNGALFSVEQTVAGPERTEALRLFGDVTFHSRDLARQYSALAAGSQFTLAVTDHAGGTTPDVGRVVGFGHSQFNQCVLPGANEGLAQVSAGATHSMALTNGNGLGTEGSVMCWGDASSGKCAVPSDLGVCRAIAAGSTFSMALTTSGQVRCWGLNTSGQCTIPGTGGTPPFPSGFVLAIAAGESHAMALVSQDPTLPVDAVVHVWGNDASGQITREPAGLTDVVQIAAGANHCVALKEDGTVVAWGRTVEGQSSVPPGLSARQIDAKGNWSLAVSGPSSVITWGAAPAPLSAQQQAFLGSVGVRLARAGVDHLAILTEVTRTLVMAGSNEYFQCNGEVLIDRIAGISAGRFSFAAWNDIGRFQLFCTEQGTATHGVCSLPPQLERVHQIALGQEHAVAIERNTRRVFAWGNTAEDRCSVPAALTAAACIAAGEAHSAAIAMDTNSTLHCWGRNTSGQTAIPSLGGVAKLVACGRNHTLAIVVDAKGRVSTRAWGQWGEPGPGGQLVTVPESLTNQPIGSDLEPVAIAGGGLHSMVLLGSGTVVSWGIPGSGQFPTPGSVGNCRGIAAGAFHSVAVTTSDRVAAWGSNAVNQVAGPKTLAQVPAVAAGDNRTLVYTDTVLPLPNDIDGNGCTDGTDLGALLSAWGTDGAIPDTDPPQNADLNADGVVNGADLGLLLEDWYANIDCGG